MPEPNSLPSGWGEEIKTPPEADAIFSSEKASGGILKKILIILLIFLVVGGVAFFLIKKGPSVLKKTEEISLNYWGLWEPEEVMKNVLSEWEEQHPNIKINYVRQNPKEYRERLQSALARNEGPDIFRFHITWLPMFKDELEPLPATVMSATQFEGTFYPVASSQLRSGSHYLGLPLMIDTLALYYNEDIFQAAGKTPPKTWEELRRLAVELTIRDDYGRIQRAGVALGTTNNIDHWSDILGLMMLQNGADLTSPATCRQQGEEEVCLGQDALTFYTIFKIDGVWNETLPSSTMAFATGKLAMYFAPSWRVFEIININPNLNFKVAPVPQLSETNIGWASFWVEGVSQRSEHKEGAWEFLKFLSAKETLTKLYQTASNLRLFGEPYPRVDMVAMLGSDPIVEPFVKQASYAQTWYLCSNTWDNGINDRMIKYYEDAVNSVNAGRSAKQALTDTAQGVSQLLSQYGLGAYIVQ